MSLHGWSSDNCTKPLLSCTWRRPQLFPKKLLSTEVFVFLCWNKGDCMLQGVFECLERSVEWVLLSTIKLRSVMLLLSFSCKRLLPLVKIVLVCVHLCTVRSTNLLLTAVHLQLKEVVTIASVRVAASAYLKWKNNKLGWLFFLFFGFKSNTISPTMIKLNSNLSLILLVWISDFDIMKRGCDVLIYSCSELLESQGFHGHQKQKSFGESLKMQGHRSCATSSAGKSRVTCWQATIESWDCWETDR